VLTFVRNAERLAQREVVGGFAHSATNTKQNIKKEGVRNERAFLFSLIEAIIATVILVVVVTSGLWVALEVFDAIFEFLFD
jgi:hypothetical protein